MVIKSDKKSNFTIISNYYLKDKNLSLKAKGLLTLMLSLPMDWDYSVAGLAAISKEGKGAISSALSELEEAGYTIRSQNTDKNGKFQKMTYIIFEQSIKENV